jgi:hypothetical protein
VKSLVFGEKTTFWRIFRTFSVEQIEFFLQNFKLQVFGSSQTLVENYSLKNITANPL